MDFRPGSIREQSVAKSEYADRWSKDLVGTTENPTASGFNLGVAEYLATEFHELQVHDDQEAIYVISGIGELRVGDGVYPLEPGAAVYIPALMPHAPRRTTEQPVKVVYVHGAT